MFAPNIDTLIFDLDNTLINRNEAMQRSVQWWLISQGHEASLLTIATEEIMQQDNRGYSNRNTFSNWLLKKYGNNESKRNVDPQQLMQLMREKLIQHLQPDPQLHKILQQAASRYQLMLASNGGSNTQRAKLQQAGILHFFKPENIFISGEMEYEKPDQQFFKKIIARLPSAPKNAIMIGDNPEHDIHPAVACGLHTCWVSHGRPQQQGLQPHHVITTINEISQWM